MTKEKIFIGISRKAIVEALTEEVKLLVKKTVTYNFVQPIIENEVRKRVKLSIKKKK